MGVCSPPFHSWSRHQLESPLRVQRKLASAMGFGLVREDYSKMTGFWTSMRPRCSPRKDSVNWRAGSYNLERSVKWSTRSVTSDLNNFSRHCALLVSMKCSYFSHAGVMLSHQP